MKKLTTGIFSVLLGLVAVDASAAVTSKAYVDARVNGIDTKVETLNTTVTEFKEGINTTITEQITNELKSDTSEIAKALDAKADATDVTALGTRVTAAEGDIDTLQATVSGLTTGEGSVANQIADALNDYSTTTQVTQQITTATADMETKTNAAATYATKAQLTAEETARTSADNAINAKIGTVADGKTVVQMIADAQTAASYDDTAVKASIATNAEGIAANKTAVEKAQDDATAAQTTANAAIPKPAGECADAANKCVLTYNNSVYAWEVIERQGGQ